MKTFKFAAMAAALSVLGVGGCVSSSNGMAMNHANMSAADRQLMNSCMAMSSSDRMNNANCTSMMRRMNMSDADMAMMNSCHAMGHETMMRNNDCMRMMRNHPGAMTMPS